MSRRLRHTQAQVMRWPRAVPPDLGNPLWALVADGDGVSDLTGHTSPWLENATSNGDWIQSHGTASDGAYVRTGVSFAKHGIMRWHGMLWGWQSQATFWDGFSWGGIVNPDTGDQTQPCAICVMGGGVYHRINAGMRDYNWIARYFTRNATSSSAIVGAWYCLEADTSLNVAGRQMQMSYWLDGTLLTQWDIDLSEFEPESLQPMTGITDGSWYAVPDELPTGIYIPREDRIPESRFAFGAWWEDPDLTRAEYAAIANYYAPDGASMLTE